MCKLLHRTQYYFKYLLGEKFVLHRAYFIDGVQNLTHYKLQRVLTYLYIQYYVVMN